MARILLIDDDPAIREQTAQRLQIDGHHVIAVDNADEALVLATNGPRFDVAVLDLHMPEANELRLLDRIRATPGTSSLPVVFYTTNGRRTAVHGLSLGSDDPTHGQPLLQLLSTIGTLSQPIGHTVSN